MAKLGVYASGASQPEFATEGSACFDLKSRESGELLSGQIKAFSTGLYFDIPEGHCVEVYSRSGNTLRGLIVANAPGIIDSDYVQEVKVILQNMSDEVMWINESDRVAQAKLVKLESTEFVSLKEPPKRKTSRNGGFGSTGG